MSQLTVSSVSPWQDVPFNAINFFATAPMTWSVILANILENRFRFSGYKTIDWRIRLQNSTLTAPLSNQININLPGGFTSSKIAAGICRFNDNAFFIGASDIEAPTNVLLIVKNDFANFTAVAGGFFLDFTITFEVQ